MLFQGLNKLKRQSIMMSIVLLAIGFIVVLCPVTYIPTLIDVIGLVMLIVAVVMILDFFTSKKSLVNFVMLTLALALIVVGGVILVFDIKTIHVLAWIFGIALIMYGLYTMINTLIFSRRSGRKGWWVMVVLSILLIFLGVIVIINPLWDTPESLMKIIGWLIVFSAIVTGVRLIWIWPIKSE